MPLPLIIGAGLAAGGVLGSFAASRRKLDTSQFNLDPNGQVQSQIDRLRDPSFGFEQFERLAARSAPTFDTFSRLSAAQGFGLGSPIARENAEAAGSRARGQAFDAFSQFRLGIEGSALPQLLGLQTEINRFPQELRAEDFFNRRAQQIDLFNNIAGVGSGILGNYLGNQGGNRQNFTGSLVPNMNTLG